MARGFLGLTLRLGSQRSLSARGQPLNTFAGIGFSLAFSLLALGGYLIEQQFANPLEAQSLALPIAALLIATAITLLYCLLLSSRKLRNHIAAWPATVSWEEKNLALATLPSRERQDADMPASGRYVDPARIRIQR
jgi:uncharacterized BrkB/YihY/UPF0761 family membrane protein